MFDIHFFKLDPRPFFTFAKVSTCIYYMIIPLVTKEIFPGKYRPSLSHKFVRALEERGKLLRNYTQNIDTLEGVAGIERVVYCHGNRVNVGVASFL